MRYRYFICDVFTRQPFTGNQLAVLPEAEGLTGPQMQQIAREFNFSESTFVFPPESGHTRKVRIFTPTIEVPFAGHPNIGTAFALARDGAFGDGSDSREIVFEEQAGLVPVTIQYDDQGDIYCELKAPETLSIGDATTPEFIASVLSLDTADIVIDTHPPQVASVGLPFLIVELASHDALKRARINTPQLDKLHREGLVPDIHLYCHSADDFDIRARMFAPMDGVPEDPATGSANCALVALLSHYDAATNGDYRWRISQGVEMGRPSDLSGRTEKRDGRVNSVWIGGNSVLVSEGFIDL